MHASSQSSFNKRVDELKDLFQYAQKVLKFFDELFQLYQDIIPLLDGINQSIEESTNKLPRASRGLNEVTKATEMATIEILDTLENLSKSIEDIKAKTGQLRSSMKLQTQKTESALAYLEARAEQLPPAHRKEFRKRILELRTNRDHEEFFHEVDECFKSAAEHIAHISISLQVQDITAQQLAAVNHLVESVHHRLQHLIDNVGTVKRGGFGDTMNNQPETFDPNAVYTRSDDRQRLADSLSSAVQTRDEDRTEMNNHSPGGRRTTQDEIDKLFGT